MKWDAPRPAGLAAGHPTFQSLFSGQKTAIEPQVST